MSNFKQIFWNLLDSRPFIRRLILIITDAILFVFAVRVSSWFVLENSVGSGFLNNFFKLLQLFTLIVLPVYAVSGHYKSLTRYVGSSSVYKLVFRNFIIILVLALLPEKLSIPFESIKGWILFWLLFTGISSVVKFILRDFLINISNSSNTYIRRVAIYGAGYSAAQLFLALRFSGTYNVVAFFDDNPLLWKRDIHGIPILPPSRLSGISDQIDQVLLAIPSLKYTRRQKILKYLSSLNIPVLQIPSIEEIASGKANIDSLRPIAIEELLGRELVNPDAKLISKGINNSVVCVTGGAGSIGSELCRQILNLKPKKLILLDNNEPSLYKIEQELNLLRDDNIKLEFVLGSTLNKKLIKRIFRENKVQLVFHAAAYKHVPIVENNPIQGLLNNVISTKIVCQAAEEESVDQVVLISTDKAVRPTNVMGASKRLAELIVQAKAEESLEKLRNKAFKATNFSMVRFGNVLGSSGSVVPLFKKQIALGGPITLTDNKIIRYFMTIPEAANLVLQSVPLAKGGDVFLLDMGKPVYIRDLAEKMVRLSGLTIKDNNNPTGDIEIIITGLRPGEKLFEELLIDGECHPTEHPLIFRAQEKMIPPKDFWPLLETLESSIDLDQNLKSLALLEQLVPQWKRLNSI